ncbi:MAG: cysteine--tRNA ligase [Chitinophagaceae bacterium]
MSRLQVYNSYNRKKEVFKPLHKGFVGMYVCGPTVSGESHLGHARPFITFDVIYRYLKYWGYQVRYVRNITDAGHFEEEGRIAEDKVSIKAVIEKLEPMELVQKYTRLFHEAMDKFNCLPPTIEPTATGHIVEQIEMIKQMIVQGYAYEMNGSVYFDVKKYASIYPYGKLSGRKIDDFLEATRSLNNQEEKHDSADFALWKKAPPEHLMRWASPWGEGFPGWHIECSAMSSKYLGTEFDIHGGGMDLQFPHHESEIAQSTVCHYGKMPARYWLHNNMITINGKKMGKSYNNVIKLSEMFTGKHFLLVQAYAPMTIRFFILQTHYRSTLDFSNEALQSAEKGLARLWNSYQNLLHLSTSNMDAQDPILDEKIRQLVFSFEESMNDDFNTAKVLASMFELVPIINSFKNRIIHLYSISQDTLAFVKKQFKVFLEDIFGLKESFSYDNKYAIDKVVEMLLEIRKQAKKAKNFHLSDQIRHQLEGINIFVKDEKDGTMTYTIKN